MMSDVTRRSFLASAAAFAAAPAFAAGAKTKTRIALQLYSVGRYVREVQPGGFAVLFKELADLGYKGVEFAGYEDYGKKYRSAKEMKKMLDDNGLVACGTHISLDALSPQRIQRTIDSNLTVGNRLLVNPSGLYSPPKDYKGTMADWVKYYAEFFSAAAETAKKSGVRVGYHNHQKEFTTKLPDGRCVWDAFFSACSPDVCMELDVGWCATAGEDPCAWLKRFPKRSPTIHAKEHVSSPTGILGDVRAGKKGVDWDALFKVTDANDVDWYVVEVESMGRRSMVPPKGCIEFFRRKGRV